MGMSIADGSIIDAGLSLVSMIPWVGDLFAKPLKATRIGKRLLKLEKKIADQTKKIAELEEALGNGEIPKTLPKAKKPEKVSATGSCKDDSCKDKKDKKKDKDTTKCANPISMVNGEKLLDQTDFVLPGPLPLIWERRYHSSLEANYGLGHGWTCIIAECLRISTNEVVYQDAEGRLIHFESPKIGQTVWNTPEQLTLIREHDQVYCLKTHGEADKFFSVPNSKGELLLSEIRDKLDNRLTFRYSTGKLQKIVSNWGRGIKLTYNLKGLVTAVYPYLTGNEVNSPALVHYTYNSQDDLVKVTDRAGHSEQFQYKNHVIIKITKKSGYSIYYKWDRYDSKGRCLKHWGDNGKYESHFEWKPDERLSKFIDSRNGVRIFRHNAEGKLVNKTDPEGGITSFQYDEQGNPTDYVDQNGNRETNTYDVQGLLTSNTDALGNIYKIRYNPAGLPNQLTDPLGNEWIRVYDERDLLIKATDPEGNTTTYQYNSKGLPIVVTDALGYQRQLQWDSLGNLIKEIDAEGRTTTYQHDVEGNITTIIAPDDNRTHYQYDVLGQITRIIYPDGKQIRLAYNPQGLLTHYTDTAGRTTEYQYEGLSQVKRRIDPTGHVFEYVYDTQDNLIGLVNEKGERYHLKYDKNQRLVEEIGFDGRIQKYEYDPAGYLIRHLDGNRITEFKRDTLGRLLEKYSRIQGSEQEEITESSYSYDALGRLIEASNEDRTVKFEYDAVGNLIREHQDDAVIKHQYDVLGNRIRTILPDGQILDYRHDKEGLYDKIQLNGEILTQLTRDSIGRETSHTQGKLSSHFEYDPMGRLKKHYVSDHLMPLLQREYGYDKAGNLNFINDLEKGQTHIQYDALDRLRSVNDEVFAFDPASNIIINDGKQAGYTQGGRLQMQGDRHFEYDDAGNLIRERRGKGGKLVTEYHYNLQNQLIQVINQGQVITYRYDALGRRISKQDAFGETTFLWNGDVLLSETRNNIHKTYIYEPDSFRPLAIVQDGEVYYYHLDHLGTPQEMTDAQGEIVWSVRYQAYGNVVRKEVERVENNLRFQGQYFDEETGLHYNRFRYYDPDAGQFIHQDPIGLVGGDNLYLYVPNPVVWIDPLGLSATRGKSKKSGKDCEFFYRAMSEKEYERFVKNGGKLSRRDKGNSYLGISPEEQYGPSLGSRKGGKRKYPVVVRFEVEVGTMDKLIEMGATHPSASLDYPDHPPFTSGMDAPQLKQEKGGVFSIGLGSSPDAIDLFNDSIINYERI
jgi:RHS repeat-associated protein